ncbi:MAG: FKBP-type peptidyl-prolyl cis-trans isomerase [Candidatus Sigynarchaeota archaeon]
MADTIESGNVVRVHLTGRVNSHDGPVFQVTDEAVAKAEGLVEEGKHQHYEPKLVIVGKKQVIEGIDEALVGMKVGEEKKIEIPPEKAFGKSDPKKRQSMAFPEFRKRFKKVPRVGEVVELPQTKEDARVVSTNQGRVILDTNHLLADRTVYYTIKVVEKMEGEDALLNALIEQRMPGIPASELKINKAGKTLELTIPNQVMFYQQSGFMLYLLANEIQKEIPQFEKVRYIIDIEKPKLPEKPAGAEAEKPAETVTSTAEPATDAVKPAEATTTTEEPAADEKKAKKPAKKGSKKATDESASDGAGEKKE